MSSSKRYDFEGLWFSTYLEVRKLNKNLQEEGLDESQLREITTSIFIAKTQRGVVRPQHLSEFQESVLKLIEPVKAREQQAVIYKSLKAMLEDKQPQNQGNGAQ
ncbi:MAG: hypothetical protein K9N46_05445 [Candidatus Marinimicrobia bacterium]|nr:hypothetical protein [Candidatus Neomarinimicrobiota bacterium]MCF7880167.1 hypothetical protein [Candidatus Neomarinimicrobiota bacterium]